MPLNGLPNEVILHIAEQIQSARDLNALIQTSRHFHTVCNHFFYRDNLLNANASACLWAIENDRVTTLQRSIDAGAPIPKHQGEVTIPPALYPLPPIIQAAKCGSLACLHHLLDYGVDPNFDDGAMGTPLEYAVEYSQIPAMQLLLDHGAKILLGGLREVVVDAATFNNDMVALNVIFSHMHHNENYYTPADIQRAAQQVLETAIRTGECETIRYAIMQGADVNYRSGRQVGALLQSSSPILDAVRESYEEPVRTLLEYNVDMLGPGGDALIWAVFKDYVYLVRLLVERGANVNATLRGSSVVRYTNNKDLIRYLEEHGAK